MSANCPKHGYPLGPSGLYAGCPQCSFEARTPNNAPIAPRMTRETRTPGPWTIGDDNNQGCEVCMGDVAVSLDRFSRCPGRHAQMVIERGEMLANARLIAAAPDLLAALRGMLMSQDCEWERRNSGHDWREACETARSAIAKAEGGKP